MNVIVGRRLLLCRLSPIVARGIWERTDAATSRHGRVPAGAIDRAEHELAAWEKKVDATLRLLLAKRIMTLDELRRGVEELGPGVYDELTYFERWIASISNNLLEKGVLEVQELGEAIERAQRRHAEAAAA